MARDSFRDSWGRFAKEQHATFKQSGGRVFVRLFGAWAELKPVTPESIRARMAKYDEALSRAVNHGKP